MTLALWHLLSFFFRMKEADRQANHEKNSAIRVPTTGDGYIEDQTLLGKMMYGVQKDILSKLFLKGAPLSAAINSCEIIAVYNVLKYFGIHRNFCDIITDFEKKGVTLYGYFGTDIRAVADYVSAEGLEVKRLTISNISGGKKPSGKTAYIICGANVAGNIFEMIHTIALTAEGNVLRSHNEFRGGGLYPNLMEAVVGFSGGRGEVLSVYEITKGQG